VFRAVFYKLYLVPHNRVWISGVLILVLSIVVAFLEYVLPWGQMSYWGTTVITNLLISILHIGNDLVHWVWGDTSLNSATLKRFFILHCRLVILLGVIVILHILFLHKVGSFNLLGLKLPNDWYGFYKPFALKDRCIVFLTLMMLTYIACFQPNLLNHPHNCVKVDTTITPIHIVPEWYFLSFYAILTLFFIVILLFLSYYSKLQQNSSFISSFVVDFYLDLSIVRGVLLSESWEKDLEWYFEKDLADKIEITKSDDDLDTLWESLLEEDFEGEFPEMSEEDFYEEWKKGIQRGFRKGV